MRGITRRHPFSIVESVSASQTVTSSLGFNPKYAESWCQETKEPSRPGLIQNRDEKKRMFGPIKSSTASRMDARREKVNAREKSRWLLVIIVVALWPCVFSYSSKSEHSAAASSVPIPSNG